MPASSDIRALDLEALRADSDWLARLARRLARDANEADDLVQDAWIVALRSGQVATRSWLAGVLRNLARARQRTSARRAVHEQRSARDGESDSTSQLVEALSARREVTDAVLALPDPVREAVLLRYYRESPLKEIARTQRCTVSAVHRRIARGHELLRARLEQEHGREHRAWALSILTAADPTGVGPGLLGAVTMSVGAKIAATVVVAGGTLGALFLLPGDRPAHDIEHQARAAEAPRATDAPASPAEARDASRLEVSQSAAIEASRATGETSAPPVAMPAELRTGYIVHIDGTPLANLAVSLLRSPATVQGRTLSDARGAFEFGSSVDRIEVDDPDWTTILPGVPKQGEVRVVAAPRLAMGGWVVDEAGAPIHGAKVGIAIRADVYSRHGLLQLDPAGRDWNDETGIEGRFALPGVAAGPDLELVVRHPGFDEWRAPLPSFADPDIEVVMTRPQSANAIWGLVVDPHGKPVADAYVAAGGMSTRSDIDGRFRLQRIERGEDTADYGTVDDGAAVRAVKDGYLPAVIAAGTPLRSPVELRLGGPPLTIRGRVVDGRGEPVPGAAVWLADPTSFGMVPTRSAGTETWFHVTQESLLRGGVWQRGAATDDAGAFELTGLLERTYHLRACSGSTLTSGEALGVRAGDDTTIVLAEPGRVGPLRGQFVSVSGKPIAGLRLSMGRHFSDRPFASAAPLHLVESKLVTDEEGRVFVEELAWERTYFSLYLDDRFLPPPLELERIEDPGDFVHVVALPCRLQVDATAYPGEVESFRALDADGASLQMHHYQGNFSYLTESIPVEDGLSGVVAADERVQTIVLYAGTEELARKSVTLDPSELNRIRW